MDGDVRRVRIEVAEWVKRKPNPTEGEHYVTDELVGLALAVGVNRARRPLARGAGAARPRPQAPSSPPTRGRALVLRRP